MKNSAPVYARLSPIHSLAASAWGIVGLLAFYLILAAVLPAIDDEVYYWCWSKDLQWSYYDHPPMTAVLIRLSTSLFGDSTFGYRVPACLASVFVVYVISRLTEAKPLILGVILSPMFTIGAVVITPDSPLVMFWAAYLWWLIELHRRFTPQPVEPMATTDEAQLAHSGHEGAADVDRITTAEVTVWWWILGGILLGCGVLSKYTMALAVPTSFVSLLLARVPWRRWLPGYIGHGAVSFVVASPILIYNIGQDFEPLLFQWRHAAQKSPVAWISFGEFVGGQILLFGTLPFFLLPWTIIRARRLFQNPRLRVCVCLYLLPMLFFLYKSTRTRLEANWALVCFVSFWPVANVWYESVRRSAFWRWSTASAFLPPVLAVLVATVHLFYPILAIPIPVDRVYRQIGYNTATREIAQLIQTRGEDLPVYAVTYQLTALLRFQSLNARQIDGASRPSHFTRPPQHITDVDRCYVVNGQPMPAEFTEGFGPPELVGRVPVEVRGETVADLGVWRYSKSKSD